LIAEETEVAQRDRSPGGQLLRRGGNQPAGAEALATFAEIERRGGVVACIDSGWIQKEIHRSAVLYQRAVELRRKKIVGVNCYEEPDGEATPLELHRIDASVETDQKARLADLRRRRDGARARRELEAIRAACRSRENLLARFVAAAHADCTLGEIADVLRQEFGIYKEPKIL
jgi:methylmalonyl-CoA mutase N-terminal domain/subunit